MWDLVTNHLIGTKSNPWNWPTVTRNCEQNIASIFRCLFSVHPKHCPYNTHLERCTLSLYVGKELQKVVSNRSRAWQRPNQDTAASLPWPERKEHILSVLWITRNTQGHFAVRILVSLNTEMLITGPRCGLWGYCRLSTALTEVPHAPAGVILPAADSFHRCMTFGILGTLEEVFNARAPRGWLLLLLLNQLVVGCSWLSGCVF